MFLIIQENHVDNFTENCTDKKILVINLLRENPHIIQQELANISKVSRRTIAMILTSLKNKNVIERVGSDRKGYWKVLQPKKITEKAKLNKIYKTRTVGASFAYFN